MNKSLLTRLRLVGSLALAAVLLSACQTLEYRQVQNDFNQSVRPRRPAAMESSSSSMAAVKS